MIADLNVDVKAALLLYLHSQNDAKSEKQDIVKNM